MEKEFEPACRRMEWLDPFYKAVWEKAFAEGIPISGTFELTPRCNFNCKMCYVHLKEKDIPKYGKELSAKEWLRIAEEAKEAGTTWLCITGGEPLMHPEFPEIWKGLSEMGFFLTLQTNASMITGEIQTLLEQYPPRQVKITLYGSNDEVYEAVCGVKKGFTRVNDGIHTLMSMGIPVTLVSTIIRQNAEDAEKMAFYAYVHRLPWLSTNGVKDCLRHSGTDVKKVQVEDDQAERLRVAIEQRVCNQKFFDRNQKPCTWCRDYRVGYWILWNGRMSFCSFLDGPDITVWDQSFRIAWKQLLANEEALDWPESCKNCEAFEVCAKCAATVQSLVVHENGKESEYCKAIQSEYRQQMDREKRKGEK